MLTHRQEKYYWHRCQKRLCLNVKRMKHYWPYIAVSKFVDHLPEHRIQQMLKREQVAIPPSTMNTWTQKMAELFKLVAMQIRKEILAGKYIQMDETTIKVLFVKR